MLIFLTVINFVMVLFVAYFLYQTMKELYRTLDLITKTQEKQRSWMREVDRRLTLVDTSMNDLYREKK